MNSEYCEDVDNTGYEVMKAWRLGSLENFVGKWEEVVFNAFSDSEPVERRYDGCDMVELRRFNDNTSKRVLGKITETPVAVAIDNMVTVNVCGETNILWCDGRMTAKLI